jgi:hypothetical protein
MNQNSCLKFINSETWMPAKAIGLDPLYESETENDFLQMWNSTETEIWKKVEN